MRDLRGRAVRSEDRGLIPLLIRGDPRRHLVLAGRSGGRVCNSRFVLCSARIS